MEIERVIVRLMADATQYDRVLVGSQLRLIHFAADMTADITRHALTLAAEFEKVAISMEVMTGSATVGKKLLKDIVQLAIETPFHSAELLKNAGQLKAFGFETSQIIPTLQALGDVSSGTGTELNRIVRAFGQVRVAGRLLGTELRQFTDANIPLIENLAKVMEKPQEVIRRMVRDGKVGFPEVQKAFNLMTQEGGLYFRLMERINKETTIGRWQSFTEKLEITARNFGLAAFEGLHMMEILDGMAAKFGDVQNQDMSSVVQFFDGVREAGLVIKGLVAWIERMSKQTSNWAEKNREVLMSILRIAGAVAIVIIAIQIIMGIGAFIMMIIGMLNPLTLAIIALAFAFEQLGILETMADTLSSGFNKLGEIFGKTWRGIVDAVKSGDMDLAGEIMTKGLIAAWKTLVATLKQLWYDFIYGLVEFTLILPKKIAEGAILAWKGVRMIADVGAGRMEIERDADKHMAWVKKQHDHAVGLVRKERDEMKFDIADPARAAMADLDRFLDPNSPERIKRALDRMTPAQKAHKGFEADLGLLKDIEGPGGTGIIRTAELMLSGLGGFMERLNTIAIYKERVEGRLPKMIAKWKAVGLTDESLKSILGEAGITGHGPMTSEITIGSEARIAAERLQMEMNKGVFAFDKFSRSMRLFTEAHEGPIPAMGQGLAALGFSKVFGQVLDSPQFRFGIFDAFGDLQKSVAGQRAQMSPVQLRGTIEAQDTINRSQMASLSTEQQVLQTLLAAKTINEQQRDHAKRTADALEELIRKGVLKPDGTLDLRKAGFK